MRLTCLPSVLVLLIGVVSAHPASEDTPSALASLPEGWTDFSSPRPAPAPTWKGWTRLPIPPKGTHQDRVPMVPGPEDRHPPLSGRRRP